MCFCLAGVIVIGTRDYLKVAEYSLFTRLTIRSHLSLVVRKPVFGVSDQV